MESRDASEIQDQVSKLLEIIAIMPFKLINGPLVEEIND